MQTPTLTLDREGSNDIWRLAGDWSATQLRQIAEVTRDLRASTNGTTMLDGSDVEKLDTAGAWQLLRLIDQHHREGDDAFRFEARGFSPEQKSILELVAKLTPDAAAMPVALPSPHSHRMIETLGRRTEHYTHEFVSLLAFFGQISTSLWYVIRHPAHFRLRSFVYHLNEVGIRAMPIIALLALLISIVIGYQGIEQLRKFNAQAFTIDASIISILREMGVLLTAIMVAGRSGSAFTAAIGTMKLNQEVDAMRTLGLDPFEVLVIPRLLAIIVAMPILAFLADLVGILGTFFVANSMLGMTWPAFFSRIATTLQLHTFAVGIVKAPVFGLLIGTVGCMRGMRVASAAEEVGKETTISVVNSIFLILLFDALFSILFTALKV